MNEKVILRTEEILANSTIKDHGCCVLALIDTDGYPIAAIFAAAIAMLPVCMDDLLNLGIPSESITVFDLHRFK